MKLVYNERYKLIQVQVEFAHLTGEKVTIELKKGDDVVVLESGEDDFCSWGTSLHNVYNSEGEPELAPIKDGNKYYDDIARLIDEDNTKIGEAWKRLQDGSVKLDFNINENINKLLLRRYNKKDEDIIKLNGLYWEVLAYKMYEAKNYQDLALKFKDELFLEYQKIIDKELTGILGKEENFIIFYRKMNEVMTFDFFELINQAIEQYRFVTELAQRLTKEGPLPSKMGANIILDGYRRLTEIGKQVFLTLYYLIQYNRGKSEFRKIDYVSLISELKEMDNISKVIEYVDPFVRNSESHCSTKLMEDKEGKIQKIRIIDNRKKRSKILNEYSLEDMVHMFNKVKNASIPAAMYSIGLLMITMGLLLLRSAEYKFLILRLGQE